MTAILVRFEWHDDVRSQKRARLLYRPLRAANHRSVQQGLGGYQVIKKWLSYREHNTIERALSEEEVSHVQAIARRLAAILLLGPRLDASYRACALAHQRLERLAILVEEG